MPLKGKKKNGQQILTQTQIFTLERARKIINKSEFDTFTLRFTEILGSNRPQLTAENYCNRFTNENLEKKYITDRTVSFFLYSLNVVHGGRIWFVWVGYRNEK